MKFIFLLGLLVGTAFAATELQVSDDPNFSSSTTNFSVGQKVYIRIDTSNPGNDKQILKLLDNLYNEITTYNLSRSGEGPYVYSADFSAPNDTGYYSLEGRIESGGETTVSVKTIKIGSAEGNVKVKTKIENQTNDSNSDQTLGVATEEAKEEEKSETIFDLIAKFFDSIANFFKNLRFW
ncbi:MAG: hypothetical protein A2Y57_00670 [Candidatus Woykebacteria bacterium RBG_13_40_7b]|uniref:YtkA-like domain-containing protein n=1 Tax=Candidatus Woykebacteria bacterium RBG_13_40_7b TaxID=1802594 RepID=A0A1G1W8H7_9BACT|nr:MAG: hypothetical protein A2Y57_00670 [Candidatus Woykebacteria bacterium RBG_13_40_7b]